ncbi:hypothetical protein [Xanthomonas citri]|uniref:hypothetical protein n=1 Tax=Xanthomonas citri TaxID=346 RepID=UPI000B5CBD3D|nr:hypothetical protein [Xanthomonas citri]ASL01751.1 hypothetical protein XcvCFBP7113P_16645 [Xanthomonas citri pv. vignicola]
MVAIPKPQAPIADRAGLPTREWYTYLLDLANSVGMTPAQRNQLEQLIARVVALEGSGGVGGSVSVQGLGSVIVNGVDIVQIYLDGDNDAPGASWYYGTGPDGVKGWYAIADALAVTTDLTKAVDTDTGVATFGLADLADTGVAAGIVLRKFTRDTKGRLSGTAAATTSDLPEGTSLYFTNGRADARADGRIAAQKGQPNGLASLGADGKVVVAQLPAIAITETFVVGSQAAQLALTAQEGDVAVRTDLSKSYIKNSGTAGTMADWTELLSPSGGSVLSVNARTGAVAVPDFVSKATAPTATDYGRALINGDRWRNTNNGVLYTQQDGAWLYDNAASLSRYVPAYVRNGASSPIPLNADGSVPAYLRNGTATSFPLQA